MPILIRPLLFLVAFAPMAVLFASIVGLAGWLLMMCARAIARLVAATETLLNGANSSEPERPVPRLHLRQPASTSTANPERLGLLITAHQPRPVASLPP